MQYSLFQWCTIGIWSVLSVLLPTGFKSMHVEVVHQLESVNGNAWNRLVPDENPFLSHAFLVALERHQCVGENHGWLPRHLLVWEQDILVGAMPFYLKDNSYGEFVFDFAWADAYHRAGFPYYPKLVSAIPYTPITAPCAIVDATLALEQQHRVRAALFNKAIDLVKTINVSSAHFLFPPEAEMPFLENEETIRRLGVQFHWHNNHYSDFDDFLMALSSTKRKKLKRDRRFVQEAGVQIRLVTGHEADEHQIELAEYFYRTTFEKKWGYPTLSLPFFKDICQTLGEQVLFFFAEQDQRVIACAICFKSRSALYGRHWGCNKTVHGLHFELCYHQGIEYCIQNQLALFEPGAQGEHKISRGFIPTLTYSSHWVSHPQFRQALKQHCQLERESTLDYLRQCQLHSPYRQTSTTA